MQHTYKCSTDNFALKTMIGCLWLVRMNSTMTSSTTKYFLKPLLIYYKMMIVFKMAQYLNEELQKYKLHNPARVHLKFKLMFILSGYINK